jgi:hypothetical protein
LTVFRRRRETDDPTDRNDPESIDEFFDEDAVADAGEDAGNAVALDAAPADGALAATDDGQTAAPASEPAQYAYRVGGRPRGPWDSHDVPRGDEVPRVDLGGILVPVPDGMEVRVEVQDETPVAATLVDGTSQLQVHAFAAPKSSGLWAEVRSEIAQSLQEAGGAAEHIEGPFGTELRARIPAENGTQTARFIGVDGPRWFLRGLLTGPGSTDAKQAQRLESAFRDVVVQRGSDAMAPRDMLPLHLPRDAQEVPPPPEPPDRSLQLPERGPEITEIQ